MIDIKDLSFEYFTRDEYNYLSEMITAINEINFTAEDGEFVVIAGRNGSGKSTFARILNRLLVPIDGQVSIYGLDALNPENIYEIRKKVSMIFQDPDSQIIGSIVEEDIAVGMENLGFSRRKIIYSGNCECSTRKSFIFIRNLQKVQCMECSKKKKRIKPFF